MPSSLRQVQCDSLGIFLAFKCYLTFEKVAVRDCELLSCPPTSKFEQGRMLELPLKPKLLLHFVMGMVFIFSPLSVIFRVYCNNINEQPFFVTVTVPFHVLQVEDAA